MNILHTETLYNWGGQQNKVINEMVLSRELGHNVMLFCNPNSQISEVAKEKGFEVFECKMSKKTYHKSIPTLCKIIKDKNINLVITHGSTDSWNGAIARIFRKKGVKFARERHNMYPVKGVASKFMHKFMFDKIIYISQSVREYMQEVGVNENKLFYLPDTVDTKNLSSIQSTFKEEQSIKNPLVIGTFTSLYRKKGVYDFALAAKEILKTHKDATIVFGGSIRDEVKDEISAMFDSKENIIFTGFRKDSVNLIKSYDVYALASHSEGLGTVLLEAMCAQTPIVVYDEKPMSTLIKHEERGLCAAYKDSNSLARNIIKFISDKDLKEKCTQNSLEYVKQNHDHSVLKDHIKTLLEQI
ncbi:glycosyltransferase family 4 protein [Campylobacter sp. RM16188]|uniref:glycosyltransferase family 4 protein n=1 Tax=Campylobacter sp. RM16188 TaxID=1705725 RepID=UPI0015559A03|nr:glycosyltransferase family 4 protein [Campylobacter sp. RM16188]